MVRKPKKSELIERNKNLKEQLDKVLGELEAKKSALDAAHEGLKLMSDLLEQQTNLTQHHRANLDLCDDQISSLHYRVDNLEAKIQMSESNLTSVRKSRNSLQNAIDFLGKTLRLIGPQNSAYTLQVAHMVVNNPAGIPGDGDDAGVTGADMERILDFLRNGQKIMAIKTYREVTRVGLKEAKEAVESIQLKRGL